MIELQLYKKIEDEIKQSLLLALDRIKTNNLSNYILLMANGEFHEALLASKSLSPYMIEYTIDRYLDTDRLMFLTNMLNTFYSFGQSNSVYDKSQLIHLELMTYTHIWESKPFLKKLYRIAHSLKENDNYKWSVEVPDIGKHKFIRNDIINSMKDSECRLSDIIKKGYHSSLRNAFAHSEYYFSPDLKQIELSNYKGEEWELKAISFDDWAERFVYSALLSYHLYSLIDTKKKNLVNEFGTRIFTIESPSRDGKSILKREVRFCENRMEFEFNR